MTIDFNKVEETILPHFKGGEGDTVSRMVTDGINKIMSTRLDVGCSIGYHTHDTSSEIMFILSGRARYRYDDGEEILTAGQCHYCPKGHSHALFNDSDTDPLFFFAVVPEHGI